MPPTYNGSPRRKKKRAATDEPVSKKSKRKKQQNIVCNAAGMSCGIDLSRFKKQHILLTDEIYETEVPKKAKGKLFHYVVVEYDEKKKLFDTEYRERMIDPEGSTWISYKGGRDKLNGVSLETVERGRALYISMSNHAKTLSKDKKEAAIALLNVKKFCLSKRDVDLSDLNEAADNDPKFWYGESVINLEFELTGAKR